jgi:hypothetical protein
MHRPPAHGEGFIVFVVESEQVPVDGVTDAVVLLVLHRFRGPLTSLLQRALRRLRPAGHGVEPVGRSDVARPDDGVRLYSVQLFEHLPGNAIVLSGPLV